MTDDIIKSCGCFATEACDHYERPGVLKHCPSCAAKDAELKAYKANSFCTFCAGKEDELKEQTRKSDVIIAAKDAAMWRKDREIDFLRSRIEVLEKVAEAARDAIRKVEPMFTPLVAFRELRAALDALKEG